MKCIPNELWNKRYDGIPMWKYLYHTLFSMDRWYMNPCDSSYQNPEFHTETLADLNIIPKDECLKREQLENYFYQIEEKIKKYIRDLKDGELSSKPENCDMTRFCLILGQFRHWHRQEIISIYLLPDYMGRGFGKALFDSVIVELKNMGYRNIFLWVLEENLRARKFMKKRDL